MNDSELSHRDKWLTLAEASKTLGVDARTLERLIETRNIPVIQLDRGIRVTLKDLDLLKKPLNNNSLASTFELGPLPPLQDHLEGEVEVPLDKATWKKATVVTVAGDDVASRTVVAMLTAKLLKDRGFNRVCVVDTDFRNGCLGFMTGNSQPTALNLHIEGISEKTIRETAISNPRLGVDLIIAPKRPRNAEKLKSEFIKELVDEASKHYDYIILSAPAYTETDTEIETYRISDFLIYVVEPVVSSIFCMTRWIQEVTKPVKQNGKGVSPAKVGIVVNNASSNVNMSSEKIERSALGLPIISAIPTSSTQVYQAVNLLSTEVLLTTPQVMAAYRRIVDAITH